MAKNLELREKIDGYFNNTDSLIYLRSHWDHLDGKPADYTPAPHDATHKAYNDALYLGKLAKAADSSLLDGTDSAGFIKHNEVLMPTNPFGGRKLYINSIDNAMYAADKKWIVTVTRHLVSYGGETYPKLNPDYSSSYTVTGTGVNRVVSGNPSHIIVFEDNTLKSSGTHYTYNSGTGALTFTYTPTGTIYVYPGHEIPEYLDSPVNATYDGVNLFNGSYENNVQAPNGYYLKVRITPNDSGYSIFGGYPYGKLFLSYYYTGTPDKAEYRVYNYSYRPHTPGWKKYDMLDFTGSKTSANYIQYRSDEGNYGRTILEFIIYGHDTSGGAYTTSLTQIDWQLSRPNLSTSGGTVTKFGSNKLYHPLYLGDRTTNKIELNPNGDIKVYGLEIYHPGNKPTPADIGAAPVSLVQEVSDNFNTFDNYTQAHAAASNPHGITPALIGAVPTARTIGGINLVDNITATELTAALNVATTSLKGVMSATDKARLDTLYALLDDSTDGSTDALVDNITEVLAIFANYPEGVNLLTALANKLETSEVAEANTASKVVKRNSSGDIFVRLLRSEYATTTTTPNYFLVQHAVGAGADNYARPSTLAQVKAALGEMPASSISTSVLGSGTPSETTFLNGLKQWSSIAFSVINGDLETSKVNKYDGDTIGAALGDGSKSLNYMLKYLDVIKLGVGDKAADSNKLDGNTLAEVRAGVTASDVGLENVDNVADVNKYVAGVKETRASVNTRFWTGTLSEYNAIGTKSSNTIYFVTA